MPVSRAEGWAALPYQEWRATRDTLHCHTQVLGKLAALLAPPEPQLQHCALRLTARGWETLPLPAPDGSGAIVLVLNLHLHQTTVEHSDGRTGRVPLTPQRSVGEVTREVLQVLQRLVGPVAFDARPQETQWSVPLDEDDEHATYEPAHVTAYHAAATRAAAVLNQVRAPYRGRATPVNAWWGSFDLAVSLFSGRSADPGAADFIRRNSMDAQEIAIGWWPGDSRYPKAAFYAYAHPSPEGYERADLGPRTRWEPGLGEFILDWEDVWRASDPHGLAVSFASAAVNHGCAACDWDPALSSSLQGRPPPIR
jgi:hypothetical protein